MANIQEKFKELLEKHKCSDLPVEKEPIVAAETLSPADAFRFLAEMHIRACPVKDSASKEIVGTLDLRDACAYIVENYWTKAKPQKEGSMLSKLPSFGKSKALIKTSATSIAELARARAFKIFDADTSLLEIAKALSAGSHIIGISGGGAENCGVSRVITQGMLLKFLAPSLVDTRVPVKAAMTSPIITIKCTDPALKGFDIMASKGVSSLAVVEETGIIIHNMSSSDVKIYLGTKDFQAVENLDMPLEEFLAKKRQANSAGGKGKSMAPISVCKEDDDLSNVVTKLVKTGYHRVWVVKEKKPIGVLSLTDVFKKLVPRDGSQKEDCSIL